MSLGKSIIPVIAADRRKQSEDEINYYIAATRQTILRACRRVKYKLEELAQRIRQCREDAYSIGISPEIWEKAQLGAVHNLFGDPNLMYRSESHRMHSVPYWNPTAQKVNIHSLGIMHEVANPEDQGATAKMEIVDFVEPGARVFIPFPYTVGGKHSSIHGVAPQLRPLPTGQIDEELDIGPTTYVEWCTYQRASTQSKCCKKMIVWSDYCLHLVCAKCGERQTGQER